MGAIASGGARVLNEALLEQTGLPRDRVDAVVDRELEELRRREQLYRGDSPRAGRLGQDRSSSSTTGWPPARRCSRPCRRCDRRIRRESSSPSRPLRRRRAPRSRTSPTRSCAFGSRILSTRSGSRTRTSRKLVTRRFGACSRDRRARLPTATARSCRARASRVGQDVLAGRLEVRLVSDDPGREAAVEQVAAAVVALVEPLCIRRVQAVHSPATAWPSSVSRTR